MIQLEVILSAFTIRVNREFKHSRRLLVRHIKALKNKHLSNSEYFAIIAFCSQSIPLTNYAENGLVGGQYN